MKNLIKMALVLVGFASIAIQTGNALTVTVSSNNLTLGHMNVYNLDGTSAGWGSGWGIPDLRANFSNGGSTVTLLTAIS